ncbi:hypothetical protein [Baekduia sp. Peel2402]|uniref:hypothetical protein n=1 Tax=Baekduia sp. Peel2402 TaxID=3458296 RepID=UPI00403E556B
MRTRVLVIGLLVAAVFAAAASAAQRLDTVAGSGAGGYAGDGGAATAALLTAPSDVSVVPGGGGAYLIADTSNHRIRRVAADGTITTVAGAGPITGQGGGFAGNGVPATDPTVRLNFPRSVSATADGGFLFADTSNNVIRRVSAAGIITTAAGIGLQAGTSGDGGPATNALLNAPQGVAATADGGFLIADTGNNRVRRVDAAGGISASASLPSNPAGFSGDGSSALGARLTAPSKVAALPGGGYLIADTGNNRIRRVSAGGVIDTVAGSATVGFAGDGGPATAAGLAAPEGVAPTAAGGILIADTGDERVRAVAPDGTISTLAGTGVLGLSGDGGEPAAGQVSHPRAAVENGSGGVLIADAFNHRIRAVTEVAVPADPPRTTPPAETPPVVGSTPPPGVSPPVLGRTAVARVTSGTIRIRRPGTSKFVLLGDAESIAMGTEVDAREGTVALFFVTREDGKTASASIGEGRVLVTQPRELDGTQRPGRLTLSGPLVGCRAVRRAVSDGPPPGRRVRVRAKGRIKTQGRYGSAIVRGTRWIMVDRCASDAHPGTLTAVQEGVVAVRDFGLRKTVRVRAGQRYLAKPPASARRR